MLKLLTTVAVILWIVVGMVALVSFAPTVENAPDRSTEEQKGRQCKEKSPTSLVRTVFCNVGGFVDAYHDDISAASTVIIAIFTTILGLFTISLSNSTRIAAKAAEKALTELERPWLFLSSVSIRIHERAPPGEPILFNRWFAKLHWKNIGRSPAFVIKCTFTIVDKATLPATPAFDDRQSLTIQQTISVGEIVETNEVGPALGNDSELIFAGCIVYAELNGTTHETGFALAISPVMPVYVQHNNAKYNYYT